MTGPDDVRLYVEYESPLSNIRIGDTVRMTVMPCKTSVKRPDKVSGNVIYAHVAREQRDDEVCLAYNGIPCAFMRDATNTLMKESKDSPVELEVICDCDHLGKPNPTFYAKWNKFSDEQRAEYAARQAERDRADALQFHLRVNFEDWNGNELLDDEYFDAVELTADGDTIHVSSGGKVLFDTVPSMKYYDVAKERLGIPVTKMRARPKTEVKKPYIRVDFYYREKNW